MQNAELRKRSCRISAFCILHSAFRILRLLLLALLALFPTLGFGKDWPQWRGPNRNSITPEIISTAWPAQGPTILWRAAIGTGFSSIAVSKDRAYTMGNTNAQDAIWCFDALTGKELWRHSYPSPLGPQWYEGGPGATPTVADGHVFTMSKWGDVFCLDAKLGTVLWQRDLRQAGLKPNRWGFAGSPLVWVAVDGLGPRRDQPHRGGGGDQ